MIKGLKQHKFCYISKVTVQALILSLNMEQKTQFCKLLDDHIATLNAKKQESFCVTQAKYAKILSTLEVSKGAKCNEGASFKYWCHKHFKVVKLEQTQSSTAKYYKGTLCFKMIEYCLYLII